MEETHKKGNVGTVVLDKNKYFLEVAGERERHPLGAMIDEAHLKKLVGKDVEVIYSDPKPFIVGVKVGAGKVEIGPEHLCYFILCYYPPFRLPWIMDDPIPIVNPAMRTQIATKLLNENVISEKVYEKISKF